jgi:NADPH:quinone reductase
VITAIPETMSAVCLNDDGRLILCTKPVPHPGKGEVLVRMTAAPVNPSDLARIRQVKEAGGQASFIPGIEGCGTVVERGPGLLPRLWLGRRVACSAVLASSGTWAEYLVTSAANCIPLQAGISDDQGAMMLVNPMTAVAFLDIARSGRHKAIINTASASALGRMIERLAAIAKLPLINVVRNEKQKAILINTGSGNVLDSSVESFTHELQELARRLDATLILDAVGGNLTRQLLQAVPYGSSVLVYGNLSGEQPEVDHRSLVAENKKINGFYLANWLNEGGLLRKLRCIYRVRKLVKNELPIKVQRRFPLDQAQQAVDTYLGNMTTGKVLLVPPSS